MRTSRLRAASSVIWWAFTAGQSLLPALREQRLASFQLTPPQDAREFEQLMRDYCNCIYPGMACLFARPGQKQYGVDVVSTGSNGVVAIQCKNYQDMSVSISMIDQWIQGAEEFKPEISHFIIAIGAKTDGEIQKYVLEKNQYRQSHNLFSVEVVYWEEISAFLKSDARILQRYYPFINTDGIQDQFDIAYSSLDIIRHDFVELILRYKILDFLLEDPFVGIKTEYLILSDKFDIALKDLLQRTVFLQETELYQKIIAFCGKWNKYNGYIGLKVQPSNNGQYVRMNQVLMEDYEEIEAIVQRMKSEICEIYESISQ